MPGYEVKFTSPLDKAFECPICLIALREPVQITPCGHRMCSTCLQPILKNKRPRCPLDNLNFDPVKVFEDNGCHRQILNLQVLCSNLEKGCEWTGPLSDVESHQEVCNYVEVACPKHCGASLERRNVPDHSLECANRLTICTHCDQQVVFSHMNLHLQTCASFPVSCPASCGEINLTKEKIGLTSLILIVIIFVHFLIKPAMRLKKSDDENGNVDQSFTLRKLLLVEMDS